MFLHGTVLAPTPYMQEVHDKLGQPISVVDGPGYDGVGALVIHGRLEDGSPSGFVRVFVRTGAGDVFKEVEYADIPIPKAPWKK